MAPIPGHPAPTAACLLDLLDPPDADGTAAAIADWALRVLPEHVRSSVELGEVGSLAGHVVDATYRPRPGLGQDAHVELRLRDVPASAAVVSVDSICDPDSHGVVRVLENRVAAIGAELGKLDQQRASAVAERDTAEAGLDAPFKHETALTEAHAELERIDNAMAAATAPAFAEAETQAEPGPEPASAPPAVAFLRRDPGTRRCRQTGRALGSDARGDRQVRPRGELVL